MAVLSKTASSGNSPYFLGSWWFYIDSGASPPYTITLFEAGNQNYDPSGASLGDGKGMIAGGGPLPPAIDTSFIDFKFVRSSHMYPEVQVANPDPEHFGFHIDEVAAAGIPGYVGCVPMVSTIYLVYDPGSEFGNTLCVQMVGNYQSLPLSSIATFESETATVTMSGAVTPYVSAHYSHLGKLQPKKWMNLVVAIDLSSPSVCDNADVGPQPTMTADTLLHYVDNANNAARTYPAGYPPGEGTCAPAEAPYDGGLCAYDPYYFNDTQGTWLGTNGDVQTVASGVTVKAFLNRQKLSLDRSLCMGSLCRVGAAAAGEIQAAVSADGYNVGGDSPSISIELDTVAPDNGDVHPEFLVTQQFGFNVRGGATTPANISMGEILLENRTDSCDEESYAACLADADDPDDCAVPTPFAHYAGLQTATYTLSIPGFDIDWSGVKLGFPFHDDISFSYNTVPIRWAGVQMWIGTYADPEDSLFSVIDGTPIGTVLDLFISPSGKFMKPDFAQSVYGVPAISLNGNFSEAQFVNMGTEGGFSGGGTIEDADGPPKA